MQSHRRRRGVIQLPGIATRHERRAIILGDDAIPLTQTGLHLLGIGADIRTLLGGFPIIGMTGPRLIEINLGLGALGADAPAELRRTLLEFLADGLIGLGDGRFLALPLEDDDIPAAFIDVLHAASDSQMLLQRPAAGRRRLHDGRRSAAALHDLQEDLREFVDAGVAITDKKYPLRILGAGRERRKQESSEPCHRSESHVRFLPCHGLAGKPNPA